MNRKVILLTFVSLPLLFSCNIEAKHDFANIEQVPFTKVLFNDVFWTPRIETNRTVSIPAAFSECEKSGRFNNFALAGHLIKGEHKGDFPFDDTDPYKIIEGASYSLAVKYDAVLDHCIDSVITLIAAAQEPDGYLTTCVTNKCERLSGWWGKSRWEKINSHELYNSGHLYEAAVAHFQATGKKTLLDVAIKNADLVCTVFGPGPNQKHVPSGHPIVEMALAKLYKVTGEKKYLDLAKYFIEETGRGTDGHKLSEYSQDHMPILKQDEIKGHAVRAGYLYSGVADVAALTQDNDYFDALTRIWDNMTGKKLYLTGGIGSRAQGEGFGPNYELHNQQAYAETCAAISNVYWNERMFLATGDAKYIDVLERALYNGVISGVSLSGNKFFYDNPLESCGQHERQPWFGCACCPGNITRFMASVPGYTYATLNNDVFVNLYVQSKANIKVGDKDVELTQTTHYPWEGSIKLTVNPSQMGMFTLKMRIPGWARQQPVPTDLYHFAKPLPGNWELTVNGVKVTSPILNGFVAINREWKCGDVVELVLPMDVQRIQANSNVKDDEGKLALQRGPMVYCIEGIDQEDHHVFNKFIPLDAQFDVQYQPNLLNGVVTIVGKAVELTGGVGSDSDKEVDFKAIPYSVWNNRGSGEMAVWIASSAKYARPIPEPTIASQAMAIDGYGFNDQWEPKSSSDISHPYHDWWLKKGSEVSIGYEFAKPEIVSKVQIYWLDFNHYDGNYRVPSSWKLLYKEDNHWNEVKAKGPYTTNKDCYNKLDFEPVFTTALKVVASLQKDESGGVIEWKVN